MPDKLAPELTALTDERQVRDSFKRKMHGILKAIHEQEIQVLVASVVLPPPDITLSPWADENRRLRSESAAERGEWRSDRAPYQRAILDTLSPSHPCEQAVLMKRGAVGQDPVPRFQQYDPAQEVHVLHKFHRESS